MPNTQLQRKVIGVPLQKSFTKTEQGFLLVRGKFTSDQRDMVGDIITRKATEKAVPIYRQWGNIRRMHAPDPVGKVTRIGLEDGLEWNEVEIMVIDPKACFEVENGLLQALSVGALVDLSTVDLLDDGGWVINDYSLAEISLMDHPANYDARLVLNSIDASTRNLIREQGLVPVLRSLGVDIQGVGKMADEVENPTAPVEEPVVETPAKETPAEETPAEAVEETPAEAEPVAEEVPAEAPVAEVPAAEEAQPTVAELVAQALEAGLAPAIAKALAPVLDLVKTITPAAAPAEKVEENKALDASEQVSQDATQAKIAEMEDTIKAMQETINGLSTPANRKGLFPTEEVPTEKPEEEEQPAPKALGLRDAVAKFAESKQIRK